MRGFLRFRFSLRMLLLVPVIVVALCWMYLRPYCVVKKSVCRECGRVQCTTEYERQGGSSITLARRTHSTDLSRLLRSLGVPECSVHRWASYVRDESDQLFMNGWGGPFTARCSPICGALPILDQSDARMIQYLSRLSRGKVVETRQFIQRVLEEYYSDEDWRVCRTFLSDSPDVLRWRQAYEASRTEDPTASPDR